MRDLPLTQKTVALDQNNQTLVVDLAPLGLPARAKSVSLTYSPWFRFLVEPANFQIVDRVAAYVAESFRFLAVRSGFQGTLHFVEDGCDLDLTDDDGRSCLRVELRGMQELKSVRLIADAAESVFDLAALSIVLDGRMFPDAFAAAQQVVATGDTLTNAALSIDGDRMTLTSGGEFKRV